MITAADQQQSRENAAHAARVERGLWEIYNSDEFRDLVPCEACTILIRRWVSEYTGIHDAAPSVHLFSAARNANRDLWRSEFSGVSQPHADQIHDLMTQILELLRTKGHHTPESLRAEAVKLSYKTRNELIARRDEIRQKQADNKTPLPELKQRVSNFYETQARAQDTLPADITLDVITAAPVEKIKFWIRRFGAAAVNARIQGDN